ncbi:START domain-containing protein [Pseudomonas sp. WS 5011]|uniref:START domain-containing protein n=1 Tax=Pseudomonas sp. WS 5011 TaxID=2717477 RepID=UPI001475013C|nr:START domain-containing protein [Pseudomonas sp. WS 5011]NMY50595.1 START domain-containing protein [Pseudomonas sp. WS 5011]
MVRFTGLLLGIAVLLVASGVQAAQWRLVKDEAGIQVYLQQIPGSSFQAFRGVTRIRADMPRLLALQDDVSAACAWIHACSEQKLLKHEGDLSWAYSRFHTPWPVQPRDSILQVTTTRDNDGRVTRILRGVADYLPLQQGFVRVSKVEGFWSLTPHEGEIEVIYEVHSEPGGSVPAWLANSFVVDAPFNTLQGLRELAEKP